MSETSQTKPSFIVGIGASAGGLKPIEEFFDHMPPDSGMAFVIVQHLSPNFESLMDELLGRHTGMPIHRTTDGITLAANNIYLIPPKKDLTIADGNLLLSEQKKTRGLNLPIDNFFSSLAEQLGKDAIAIVLSGSGSDGARGIKQIRKEGGLVLAQSPDSAGFDGMPRSAIRTDVVDLICDVHEMPVHLMKYSVHRSIESVRYSGETNNALDATLLRLAKFFKSRTGIDFSFYKPGTIHRRLERRMQLATVSSTDEYLTRIETDEDEADSLFRDLLVEVTRFFRDQDAFAVLRNDTLPQLLKECDDDEEFRAWVCGCATGEEAYSVAMVIHDCMEKSGRQNKSFKVFATDVHSGSIDFAGKGIYRKETTRELPPSFVDKYFTVHDDEFKVKQEIRQSVIFAINDTTKDPPFTRLNLVTCRNMLIYLLPPVQKRILSIFHFGLKAKGVLFLGPSETVGDLENEFEEVHRHWRIFRKWRDVRLANSMRIPLDSSSAVRPMRNLTTGGVRQHQQVMASSTLSSLLTRYVPPSLLVNEFNELIHCIGDARKLLMFPEGEATRNVLQLLDKQFNIPVSAALHRCRKDSQTVVFNGVRIQMPNQEDKLYQLKVESVKERNEVLYLISFVEKDQNLEVQAETQSVDFNQIENAGQHFDQLKLELNYTRETLQATVEELESSNEELQATNEELIASNEELQSTNEELQSTNEELHTVNQENRQQIGRLNEVTEDLELLLSRTSTGILFLDEDLGIRKFTRSITRYIDLQPSDIGRSIDNFTHRTGVTNLYPLVREALESGSEFTMESELPGGEPLLVEVAVRNGIDANGAQGVMLTIGKKAAQGLRFGVASKEFILPAGAGFWRWPDVTRDKMWWGPKCYQLLGMDEGNTEAKFSSWRELVHEDDVFRMKNAGTEHCQFVKEGHLAVRMKCANGDYRKFEYRAAFVMDENDRPQSMMGSFAPVLSGHEPLGPHKIAKTDRVK